MSRVGATGRLSGTNMGDFEDLGFEIQMSIQAIGPLQSMRQLQTNTISKWPQSPRGCLGPLQSMRQL